MSGNETKNKRLLVLTSASGAGHDTHALAAAAWGARLYGDTVEVTIAHALEDSHFLYRQGVALYNFIQRRMPWFHHIYYNFVELLEVLNPGTVSLGRDYYVRLLEQTRPDAILSVMDCLNRGYFEVAKSVLGPQVQCATYATEFGGGYGFSRNWVNPRADYFFSRTDDAKREAVRRGFPTDRTLIIGHLAPPAFYEAPLSVAEKATYLQETLRLEPTRFTLLLSTGGAGAQNHVAILRALFSLGDRLQVIALCGRNAQARKDLDEWTAKNAPFPVRTLGFSDEMPRLLQVSSAVLARAGATTAGEALLCQCPIIFNGLGGMMPQELPAWRYFERRGIGSAIYRASAIQPIIARWLDQPEVLTQIRSRMNQIRDTTVPRQALELLLGASLCSA